MAVDIICIEENTSPRLSFSYDINNQETKFHESSKPYNNTNTNNSDFNFPEVTGEDLSPADELFFQGRIKPLIQISHNFTTTHHKNPKSDTLKNLMEESPNRVDSSPVKPPLKFLWTGVRRSSSLHCENTNKKTSSFWSLSLLSRSKSTGSVSNSKQKNTHSPKPGRRNQSSSSSSFSMYSFNQKSPPKKKDYGNGVRVNPVLNLPPNPSKGSLSFCSLFGSTINGKYIKNKK
ncbi:uncharacterized protein LOC124930052 [Impatiens glandulifera]|uniref:uncharacterized protein LOC124930052 n=1 Tax=Impatiens glandulifera TaxID=253017 RepID=UPI001FB1907E|nr:uncharacterized protein LOC124930052 [Impatiens glandulifera]